MKYFGLLMTNSSLREWVVNTAAIQLVGHGSKAVENPWYKHTM